jgi:hypothetical protein
MNVNVLFTMLTKGVDSLNLSLGSIYPLGLLGMMGCSVRQIIASKWPGVSLRSPAFLSSSASPSSLLRKFRQSMKAPLSKRIVFSAVSEGTFVFLSQVLADSADIPEPLDSRMFEATPAALSRHLQLS